MRIRTLASVLLVSVSLVGCGHSQAGIRGLLLQRLEVGPSVPASPAPGTAAPASGLLTVRDSGSHKRVAHLAVPTNGRFFLPVAPGDYTLFAEPGEVPCPVAPATGKVHVWRGSVTSVRLVMLGTCP